MQPDAASGRIHRDSRPHPRPLRTVWPDSLPGVSLASPENSPGPTVYPWQPPAAERATEFAPGPGNPTLSVPQPYTHPRGDSVHRHAGVAQTGFFCMTMLEAAFKGFIALHSGLVSHWSHQQHPILTTVQELEPKNFQHCPCCPALLTYNEPKFEKFFIRSSYASLVHSGH